MDAKPNPDPNPRTLGNESTDPFSPALPPGSLTALLRQAADAAPVGGDPTPVVDDPAATPLKKK